MPMHQTFLDWNAPCLPQAATWVLSQQQAMAQNTSNTASNDVSQSFVPSADLSDFTLVVSGARAGRRLLEILVEKTTGQALTPPRIITLNKLPEHLYTSHLPLADELMTWLLRAQAIHDTPPDLLKALLPFPPKADDPIGQLTLAQEIQTIADELASHQHTFAGIAQTITSLVDFDDHTRWDVLAKIDDSYQSLLSKRDLIDTNLARQQAIQNVNPLQADEQSTLSHQGRLVLIATLELPPVAVAMLQKLDSDVDILIHAPAAQASGFDAAGRLIPNWWKSQTADLTTDQVHLMDRPADQAYHVPRLISQLNQINQNSQINHDAHDAHKHPLPHPDQITVGLGDANMAPTLIRTLDATGVPSRYAAGRVISQSPPAVMLAHLSQLLTRHTTRELAQALRCPAIESRVRHEMVEQGKLLLTHLDTYINDHLPHRLNDNFLEDEPDSRQPQNQKPASESPGQTVTLAWHTLLQLLPADWNSPAVLSKWSQPIAQLLETFFGQRDLQRFDPNDAILIRAIQSIATALGQQASAPDDLSVLSKFTLPQAINLLLIQIAGQLLPPESGEPAVELLGWLELQLDDAPHLIITGFNEGNIPQHSNSHWLLPDTLRQKLNLPDNHHRYIREMYMLKAIRASRQTVNLITGRTSSQGEPLIPSRLLLNASPEHLPQWITRFYDDKTDSPRAPLLITHSRDKQNHFEIPKPLPLDKPITSLSVTAFRDYIACPYRFYLKHVLRLRSLDDQAVEMDALAFGNMTHQVLQHFAQSNLATNANPQLVADYLTQTLQQSIQRKFGSTPPGVIHIQQEILRQRLTTFAHWQAKQITAGWHIDAKLSEHRLQSTFDIDDSPFTIHGRIDRCDHHSTLGHRLLDYKTGDTHKKPEKTHRKADGSWIDLQLPLYHKLAESLELQGDVHLGYILLPKDLRYVGMEQATWDSSEIQSAVDTACDIIRNIRDEKFWPPTSNPREDEFAGICMDHCLNKPQHDQGDKQTFAQGVAS